jgi:hypothetical protein
MGDRMGVRIKAAALMFIFVAICFSLIVCTQAGKAYARANLTAYQTTNPNAWEPKGYAENGTAPYLVVSLMGWDATKLMGNVGLGDGSVGFLNSTSIHDHGYVDAYFMAADISSAPWDYSRISPATADLPANESMQNVSRSLMEGNKALNDPYHSILLGRPVGDMMYQYPLSPTISAYGRLVGLPMPGGNIANIGIRSLGYGY